MRLREPTECGRGRSLRTRIAVIGAGYAVRATAAMVRVLQCIALAGC
jgi:hypothetical protein